MNSPLRIEKLRRDHHIDEFSCGQPALDRFLIRFAYSAQQSNASVTYVGLAGDLAIGFYTLVVGDVTVEDAHERLAKGLAHYPIPLIVLARLAVSREWQGRGIGTGLLRDAMARTLLVGEIAGVRALAVHAKDQNAASFYSRFDFVTSPTDSLHLFMLLKDIQRLLRK